jgi:hypothetical protein
MVKNYLSGALLVVAGLTGTEAQAQVDFRPGYIVQPAGDTVRGFVDFRGARRSANICQFRPAATAATQVLRPEALRAYGIEGEEAYRSCLMPLPDSAGPAHPSQMRFLEVLAAGPPATLYRWRVGSEETRYYVQKDPSAPLRELTVHQQEVNEGTRKYYQEIPVFRGTLSEQFADCPSVLLSLAKTDFKPVSLIAAVQRYNACRQPGGGVVQAYKSRQSLSVEALLGGQVGRLTFAGYYSPINGNFQAGPTPEVGLGLSISSRALRHKLSIRLEAHYARQRYEDEYEFTSITGGGGSPYQPAFTYQTHFQLDYLRVPLLLRYQPLRGRVRPLVEAGVTGSFLLHLTQETRARQAGAPTYGPALLVYEEGNIRHFEEGLLAGVGVQFTGPAHHNLAVLGRVEKSNGFLSTPINSNTALHYYLFLTIGLNKQQ